MTRKYVNGKSYDLEKSELLDTLPDGIQVYRKGGGAGGNIFLYNPNGKTLKEQYFELPPEDQVKYLPEPKGDRIRFTQEEVNRVRKLAKEIGMAMNRFIMMRVDEYEQRTKRPQ